MALIAIDLELLTGYSQLFVTTWAGKSNFATDLTCRQWIYIPRTLKMRSHLNRPLTYTLKHQIKDRDNKKYVWDSRTERKKNWRESMPYITNTTYTNVRLQMLTQSPMQKRYASKHSYANCRGETHCGAGGWVSIMTLCLQLPLCHRRQNAGPGQAVFKVALRY